LNYLHYEFEVGSDEVIQVKLDKQANVLLLDTANYRRYTRAQEFRYYGGLAKKSPFKIKAPYPGHWHLVIDIGGRKGTVRASVKTIKR
jgi:hypothetical protein